MENKELKKHIKTSLTYFVLSGLVTFFALIYNFILIDKLKININFTYISTFIIFGFFAYSLNSKLNFKQKLSLKNYYLYLQNIFFSLVITLILGNFLDLFTNINNLLLVCILTVFNSVLNFVLNLKFTFKYF